MMKFAGIACFLSILSVAATANPIWNAIYTPARLEMQMDESELVNLTLSGFEHVIGKFAIHLKSDAEHIATVDRIISSDEFNTQPSSWSGNFTINGKFLGETKIFAVMITSDNRTEKSEQDLDVIVVRKVRAIDSVFTGSVALLVSLLYINFGAALDLSVLKDIMRKPVGPIICFFGQFLLMPIASYALGAALFPNAPDLQLGLFFTGVSPGGGASNIWTVILKGNIHLSIAMTTISTLAAFAMMPLWLFTLGRVIFDRGNLQVPYDRIATFAIALIIPLIIGVLIQKYLPRVSKILVRLLKPISILLILFIVIFAIVTNLYLFELFSWQIVVAGIGLPFIGYVVSWIVAKLFRQTQPNALAIAIETGIQNTGIAIFLLRFSLPQPQADLTTVLPVSVAMLTPVPLFILYVILKIKNRNVTTPKDTDSIIRAGSNET